jgi:predicted DNA-binding ribbon-helix-helix protein
MKVKKPKPKNVRAVRLSDTVWNKIIELAAQQEMRPSEYIRRILESHLTALDHTKCDAE